MGFHERQGRRDGADAEEPLPGAEDYREGQQSVFVDEVVLDQRLGEAATSVELNFAWNSLLEWDDLFDNVSNQLSAGPTERGRGRDATYFGSEFNLTATGLSGSVTRGQCPASRRIESSI